MLTLHFGQCGTELGDALYRFILDDIRSEPKARSELEAEYIAASERQWFRTIRNSEYTPRAVLIDTENKVIPSLGSTQWGQGKNWALKYKDVVAAGAGGSGNNWALGYMTQANSLAVNAVVEGVRRQLEEEEAASDSQAILGLFGCGGGTGSGLGSRVLRALRSRFPNKVLLAVAVLPQCRGEIATQAYNTLFALAQLYDVADAMFLVHNDTLLDLAGSPHNFEQSNALLAAQFAGLFQPISTPSQIIHSIGQLTAHPNFKFLQINMFPNHDATITNGNNDDTEYSLEWPHYFLSASNYLTKSKSIGNMTIARGAGSHDVALPRANKYVEQYPAWRMAVPIDRHFHQNRRLRPFTRCVTVASNNKCAVDDINSLIQQAWTLFQHRAFLHHYTACGLTECDFRNAFARMEAVVDHYKRV